MSAVSIVGLFSPAPPLARGSTPPPGWFMSRGLALAPDKVTPLYKG